MNSRASRTGATPRTTRLQRPGGLRVKHKALAFAVFMALAPLAAPVNAAGLGRLNVQSSLGQPLRAEVEVTSLSREDAQTLAAKIASPDAFRQAGLEYNPALASLRFAVEPRGGRTFLRITSSQPINEPFVDLLLELNWASGKLLREYTFLLDPPATRDGQPVSDTAQTTTPAVPPVASSPRAPRPAPAARAPSRTGSGEGAPAGAGAASPPGSVAVRRGDTLSGVAGSVRPEGVSLEQAMVSIYRANPSAFQRNINLLNEGARLSIPSRDEMAAVSTAEAAREVRIQSADFSAYRRRLAGAAPQIEAPRSGQTASGAVSGRVEDKQAATGDRLRLSKPAGTGGTEGGAIGSQAGASSRAEQAVARDAALKESNSRVADLEKNVDDLKKLLELRSRAMSDLQKQLDDLRASQQAVTGQVGATPPMPAEPATSPTPSSAAKPPAAAEAAATASAPTAAAAPAAEPGKAPEPTRAVDGPREADALPAATSAPPVVAAEPDPVKPASPAKPATAAKPAPEPVVAAPSFVDDLLENPLLLPALGGVAALGAGYGLYAMRRRRKVETFEDSLIAADAFASNSLFGTTGGQSVDTSQSAYQAGMSTHVDVQATEVDPIAEADVYIAYGREAQAEDILREALARQPERQPIRYKLLQIYAARSDLDAFEAVAREMHQMTGGQGEDWEKAAALGLSIDPLHPLYGGPAVDESGSPVAAMAATAATAAAAAAGVSAFDQAAAGAATRTAPPAADDFDFPDLALDAQTQQTPPAVAAGPATITSQVTAFDLDLGESRLGPINPDAESPAMAGVPASSDETANTPPESPDAFAMPSLDFDLDIAPATRIAAAKALDELNESVALPGSRAASSLESMDLDLDLDLPALETLSRMRVDPDEGGRDTASLGLDLGTATVEADPPANGDASSPRWQEMATKLDLASAYEEIGDKEGARELLREVVGGGDSAQQQKARAMLSKIG